MFGRLDEDRARGLMLGLLLGDSHPERPTDDPLRGTCLAQLACFTLEGTIRASQRFSHRGVCHPPSVVWHAWARWAHVQGISPAFAEHWAPGGQAWPDGWLAQVRPLGVRRGSAPATVAALRASPVLPRKATGARAGHHALTRTLPIALFASTLDDLDGVAKEIAGVTHGAPSAIRAAKDGTRLAAELIHGEPRSTAEMPEASSASPGTAEHALFHGRSAAAAAGSFREALSLAAPHGAGATTTAAALFGAQHGLGALPAGDVSRLEIGWVADRLARDAFAEVTVRPGGSEYTSADDPTWWGRYPGW